MSSNAPKALTNRLSVDETRDISRWWEGLPKAARRGLRRLLQEERARSPVRLVGRLVDARERYEAPEELEADLYEYFVNHELTLDERRTFHICSAHVEARRVLAAGVLPAAFRCPFAKEGCPMRAILDAAPGCDVLLREREEESQ